jgi:ribonuclease P protein component
MRFRAEQHLRRQIDFRTAREKGRRQECGGFTLWYFRRPPADAAMPVDVAFRGPRVGVIASTAAVGCAVKRNFAKRRLREVFRHHQNLVPADCDLLLIARHALNRLEYREIEQKFVDTCRKLFPPVL